MKSYLFLLFIVFSTILTAQRSFTEAIEKGDKALKKEHFQEAINYYFAAEAFAPTKKTGVQEKINIAFENLYQSQL